MPTRLQSFLRRLPLVGRQVERLMLLESGLFDLHYYSERYPDAGPDPAGHYLDSGAQEFRDPSPLFRTRYYLEHNPDVAANGINPLVHYALWGGREGRNPNPYFDDGYYLAANPDVRASGANPLAHFLHRGRREGRDPAPRCAPRVHLYATCWNEIRQLPFFFRHYDPIVQRYVVFDEGSTDGSLDLLRGHPKVEVRRLVRTDPESFVRSEQSLFAHCWKESRGFRGTHLADWVIVCNIDEHLVHPDLGAYLQSCQEAGITAIPALGYQMLVDQCPGPQECLHRTRTRALPDPTDCKLCLFSPTAIEEIHHTPGGHAARPEGHVAVPARDELMLHNYQILGVDYTLGRFAELRTGLGSVDRERNWGFHYRWTREDLGRLFAALAERGVDTAVEASKPWKVYPRPEWWRDLPRRHVCPSPLLSIVTTVYDRADCLRSCLRSAKNLNFQDWEHIVVADRPPDDAFTALQKVVAAAGDTRIFLHNLPARTDNWGISPAEFGVKQSRGKYLAFLDDDNGYQPEHFDALIDRLESDPDLGLVYSSCLWNNERVLDCATPVLNGIDLGQVLFRRDTFRTCLGDQLPYSGYEWDWNLISELIGKGVTYAHIDRPTFIFRLKQYPQFEPR